MANEVSSPALVSPDTFNDFCIKSEEAILRSMHDGLVNPIDYVHLLDFVGGNPILTSYTVVTPCHVSRIVSSLKSSDSCDVYGMLSSLLESI